MWARLNRILPPKTRRMFIEPRMCDSQGQVRYPDIVICNSKEVIGILELKYLPRGRPNWEKDVDTFHWIVANQRHIVISNDRFRGVAADDRVYSLSKDVLYVWGSVHGKLADKLVLNIEPELRSHFLALHAETTHLERPRITCE